MLLHLQPVSREHPEYQAIRSRHYIPNHGCIGRQLHYLIRRDNQTLGIISGASGALSVKTRDLFFNLDPNTQKRGRQLKHIINNVVFRLEHHEPNLGSRVLAIWRRQVISDWEMTYRSKVVGFETFVEPSELRHGSLYRADNWSEVGMTVGAAKLQAGIKPSGAGSISRKTTSQKMIFCKWVKGCNEVPSVEWVEQGKLCLAA